MGHRRRTEKRRRLSRPRPALISFSSFGRSVAAATARRRHSSAHSISPVPDAAPKQDDSSGDEEQQQEFEIVQADFGFFDPKPSDFNGVKLLLLRYLDDKIWDLSGFVDLILEQTTVGTVIKLDGSEEEEVGDGGRDNDDDGPYGVISALNLKRYAGQRCIGELREYLLSVCSNEKKKKKLKVLLEEQAGDVGLLVSQRFVNCPYQLVPPLYDGLFNEVSWATEDEPTQELRDFFRFKSYLLVARIYMKKNVEQPKARSNGDCDDPIIYIKAEDEIFHELSSLSFTFHLHAEQLATHELKNYREMGLVMVVKADKIPKFREKLRSIVEES